MPSTGREDDEGLPRVCMMFGRARCGTTVFRSMLSTHPAVEHRPEIFNSGESYFRYLESRFRDDPALCQPEHSLDLFRGYVEEARGDHRGSQVLVLDAKRECLHVVYRSWQPVRGVPAVIESPSAATTVLMRTPLSPGGGARWPRRRPRLSRRGQLRTRLELGQP